MRKKIVVILLSLLMVFAGCTQDSKDGFEVGFIISTLNNPFFVSLKEGAEQKAEELGVTLYVQDSQDAPSIEISNIEDMISKQVDLIIINPTDSEVVASAVKSANEANIPVITVDRESEGGTVVSHVASDNVEGGKLAAQYILDLVGANAKVVELEGVPGASAAIDRGKGFNEIAKEHFKTVAKQTANFNRSEGLTVMENILQSQDEIDAVFAHNDEMALGALEAVEAVKKDIIVVGFDATEDAVKAVKDGRMSATVAQNPTLMGKLSVETAVKHLRGESVEKFIPVTLELVKR